MSNGWAVEVKIQYIDGGWSPSQIWYVMIDDKEKAELKIKEEVRFTPGSMEVSAKAQILESTLAWIGLKEGGVKQWI